MATLFEQSDGTESTQIPPELSLLISDCLEAPATFLVVQHLAAALKAKRRCLIVGLSNGFDYYNAVLRKQVSITDRDFQLPFLSFIVQLSWRFHASRVLPGRSTT